MTAIKSMVASIAKTALGYQLDEEPEWTSRGAHSGLKGVKLLVAHALVIAMTPAATNSAALDYHAAAVKGVTIPVVAT